MGIIIINNNKDNDNKAVHDLSPSCASVLVYPFSTKQVGPINGVIHGSTRQLIHHRSESLWVNDQSLTMAERNQQFVVLCLEQRRPSTKVDGIGSRLFPRRLKTEDITIATRYARGDDQYTLRD